MSYYLDFSVLRTLCPIGHDIDELRRQIIAEKFPTLAITDISESEVVRYLTEPGTCETCSVIARAHLMGFEMGMHRERWDDSSPVENYL